APIRVMVLTLLLGGSIVWAYLPVLREMTSKWCGNPLYSHAYLVPVFSAYLLWRSRESHLPRRTGTAWAGLLPLLLGVVLRLLGGILYMSGLETGSLLPGLWGMALLLGGWPSLRWSWAAIGFLLFMLPLPYRVETCLSRPLQKAAAGISEHALQSLGMAAF